jgi:transcriptional regulator with XRE-family HTH domain
MLPSRAKQILAANIRLHSGGTDTQSFREKIEKKSGVSARTIGNMMSDNDVSPTLSNIEAVAAALNTDVATLLSDRKTPPRSDQGHHEVFGVSRNAQSIIDRLIELDTNHQSPPELYALIERALDLAAPAAAKGYPSLDKLPEE